MKNRLSSLKTALSGKNRYLGSFLNDSGFRSFALAVFTGGRNIIYAIFYIILAAVYASYWNLTLGVYYLALGGMRAALLAHGKSVKDRRAPESVVQHVGIAFFGVAVIFSGTVVLSIAGQHSRQYNMIVMLAIATYTFYLFTMAVINTVKAGKSGEIMAMALRNIAMGGALVSMFSLEKSMMATFGSDTADFIFRMEAATGAGIFLILVALGINLIMISSEHRKKKR